jgi:cytochrome c biogenesis protein CcmG/thiol:disulfide interchange protein DsbE
MTAPAPHRRVGWRIAAVAAAAGALAVVLVVGLMAARDRTAPPPLLLDVDSPGKALPAARGTDPVTGRAVSLADFRGRPLFINLWASWCEPCKEEAGDIARFVRDHPDVAFVGIDVSDTKRGARRFYARYGWRHPSIEDPNATIAADLGLQALPTTLFADAQGRLLGRAVRTVTYEDLVSAADQVRP